LFQQRRGVVGESKIELKIDSKETVERQETRYGNSGQVIVIRESLDEATSGIRRR